jgi:hypothetical protein
VPSTVSDLLDAVGLQLAGTVPWRTAPTVDAPGIYLVSIDADPAHRVSLDASAPIDVRATEGLLTVRPELRLHGARPTPDQLAAQIGRFWLRDEPVLYIGLASKSVATRVKHYYSTPLGARSPHAGGWFLRTVTGLADLHVHYVAAGDFERAEGFLIKTFVENVSERTRHELADRQRPFPFANLEWPRGVRKRHGITGARAPR